MFFSKKEIKKPVKKGGNYIFILAAVFAIIMAAGAGVSGFLDWQQYKPIIEEKASAALGRKVVIAGELTGMLFPVTTITVRDIRIANAPGGRAEYMAKIGAVELSLSPLSLLSGKVDINRISLVRPEIFLEAYRDGGNNWQFSGADGAATASGATTGAGGTDSGLRPMLVLRDIAIDDAKIDFWQQKTGHSQIFDKLIIQAGLDLTDRTGKLRLEGQYRAEPLVLELDFAPAAPNTMTLSAKARWQNFAITFNGRGADFLASPPPPLSAEGDWQLTLPADTPITIQGFVQANAQELNLEKITAAIAGSTITGDASVKLLEPPVVDAKLSLDKFDPTAWQKTLASLSLPLSADGDAAPNKAKTGAEKNLGLRGNMNLRIQKLILRPDFALSGGAILASTMDGRMINIQRLGAQADGDSNIDLSGSYDLPKQNFAGRMRLNIGNLHALLAKAGLDKNPWLAAQPSRLELTGDLRLSGETIGLTDYRLTHGALQSRGVAEFNWRSRDFRWQGQGEHPDLEKFLAQKLPLNGALQLTADISGRMPATGIDYQSLQGQGRVELQNGIIRGPDFKQLSLRLKELNAIQDFIAVFNNTQTQIDNPFKILSADWHMLRGVIKSQNVQFQSPFAISDGQGEINLPQRTIDSRNRLVFVDHLKLPALGVRLFGPWAAPEKELDSAAIQAYLAQRALGRVIDKNVNTDKLQQKIDKVLQKPGGQILKNLLGQ